MRKSVITSKIKDHIESLESDWAQNYIAVKYSEGKDDAESKKQVEAGKHGMESISAKLEWFKNLLKEESK